MQSPNRGPPMGITSRAPIRGPPNRAYAMRPIAMRPIAMRPIAMRPIAMRPDALASPPNHALCQSHFWVPHLAKLVLPEKIHKSFTENSDLGWKIPGDRPIPRHIAMPLPHVYVGLHENTQPPHRNHDRR